MTPPIEIQRATASAFADVFHYPAARRSPAELKRGLHCLPSFGRPSRNPPSAIGPPHTGTVLWTRAVLYAMDSALSLVLESSRPARHLVLRKAMQPDPT